jgi:hypothetical protein
MDYVGAIIWNKLHRMQPGARSGSSQRLWWLGPDCYFQCKYCAPKNGAEDVGLARKKRAAFSSRL